MNKTQLVDAIAQEAGLTKVEARRALDAVLKVTVDTLRKGDDVSIIGFGSFKVTERNSRKGLNPRTGERIEIPARRVVKFRPGSAIEDAIA